MRDHVEKRWQLANTHRLSCAADLQLTIIMWGAQLRPEEMPTKASSELQDKYTIIVLFHDALGVVCFVAIAVTEGS